MTRPFLVRIAEPDDETVLAAFRCSTGLRYEDEVEDFVTRHLLDWALAAGAARDDPRALLLVDEGPPERLVAVAAHERLTTLVGPDGSPLAGTKAEVVAVSLEARGRTFGRRRPGDLAFSALLHDAATRPVPRGPFVAVVVADDNKASLALCERFGLTRQIPTSFPGYHWRIGRRD